MTCPHKSQYNIFRSPGGLITADLRAPREKPGSAKMISWTLRFRSKMPLETPLLELHRAAGAKIGEFFGTLLPARFGEFAKEYRRRIGTVALVDIQFPRAVFFHGAGRPALLERDIDIQCPRSETRARGRWALAEATRPHPRRGGDFFDGQGFACVFSRDGAANGHSPHSINSSSWTM